MTYILKLIILLIPVAGFLFYLPGNKKGRWASILIGLLLLSLIAVTLLNIANDIKNNYSKPPEWDFLVFWIDSNVAANGSNFYDSTNYQTIQLPYEPTNGFKEEILDVGFKYPPFTMFLFLPLAIFNFNNAYLYWEIFNVVVSLICIYMIWRSHLNDHGLLGLVLIAALLFRLPQTRLTFTFAQTNFIAMLFFLLYWKNRTKPLSGLWLFFGIVVKPYLAILCLYPVLKFNWKQLAVMFAMSIAMIILSTMAFGWDVIFTFVNGSPANLPDYLYFEEVNQSLLAAILRTLPSTSVLGSSAPLFNPLYLLSSLVLAGITIYSAIKNRDADNDDWILLSLLFLGLLIYPASLAHYGVFYIMPVALLLQGNRPSMKEGMWVIGIVSVIYLLSGINLTVNDVFLATLFVWMTCIMFANNKNLLGRFKLEKQAVFPAGFDNAGKEVRMG